jgi:hypothetical protein
MAIIRILRRLRRWLTPPGSRAPLDSSYRQPNITGTNVGSPHESDTRGGGGVA